MQEPRRLWRRYGSTIPPFLYLAIRQLLTPYKEKLGKARWSKTKRNIAINIKALDSPYEKLGEILVRQNVITKEDLRQALSQQESQPNSKLGEILVRKSLLSLSQLKFYLKNQNIKFGDFLVEKKVLNRRSLKNILALRNDCDKKIGEIVLEQSILSEEQMNELFVEYYIRRKGLFLTEQRENSEEHLSSWVKDLIVR